MKEKCNYCKAELRPLNPPVEDYIEYKFCLNVFGWKLMLLKDTIEYGCPDCVIDKQQSRERCYFDEAVGEAIANEIEKGNLIARD